MDLDDTIFQTARKCALNSNLTSIAFGRAGDPLSFMTDRQKYLFSFVNKHSVVIPNTARNFDSFERVSLSFKDRVILNFGGIILDKNRTIDNVWFDKIKSKSLYFDEYLHDVLNFINTIILNEKLTSTARIIGDFGLNFYVVVKNFDKNVSDLLIIKSYVDKFIEGAETYIHFNDNNLCVIPRYLNKSNAVSYVIDNYIVPLKEDFLTIGMGDSNSDLDFLKICDYILIPSSSQIRYKRLEDA